MTSSLLTFSLELSPSVSIKRSPAWLRFLLLFHNRPPDLHSTFSILHPYTRLDCINFWLGFFDWLGNLLVSASTENFEVCNHAFPLASKAISTKIRLILAWIAADTPDLPNSQFISLPGIPLFDEPDTCPNQTNDRPFIMVDKYPEERQIYPPSVVYDDQRYGPIPENVMVVFPQARIMPRQNPNVSPRPSPAYAPNWTTPNVPDHNDDGWKTVRGRNSRRTQRSCLLYSTQGNPRDMSYKQAVSGTGSALASNFRNGLNVQSEQNDPMVDMGVFSKGTPIILDKKPEAKLKEPANVEDDEFKPALSEPGLPSQNDFDIILTDAQTHRRPRKPGRGEDVEMDSMAEPPPQDVGK